jgi:hypothetical protein
MKDLFLIVLLAAMPAVLPAILLSMGLPTSAQTSSQAPSPSPSPQSQSVPAADLENARKARALLEQAIQALGDGTYLNIHDVEEEGRSYSFFHGRPTSNGVVFWRFLEYPDKERIEVTKERDVAYVYVADKGYEITYKGPRGVEKKDLDDYLRHRKFSIESMLHSWINDPAVALFYDGSALAGNLPADEVTLIDSKDEAVHVYLDLYTHLPIKKSYSWRDPVDKQRNVEEEIWDNYRPVQGVMTPYGFTRYYNGDMQTERFVNAVRYNQGIDEAMFDPNSGYNPNKPQGKKKH